MIDIDRVKPGDVIWREGGLPRAVSSKSKATVTLEQRGVIRSAKFRNYYHTELESIEVAKVRCDREIYDETAIMWRLKQTQAKLLARIAELTETGEKE